MKKHGFQREFSKILKNAIQITHEPAGLERPLSGSKLGGKPYLPKEFEWPCYAETTGDGIAQPRPLSFLAQINLAEVSPFDRDSLLPKTGMLYFFYAVESMTWGYDPKDTGSARVYYYEGNLEDFREIDFPPDYPSKGIIPEQSLSFESKKNLPAYEEFEKFAGAADKIKESGKTAKASFLGRLFGKKEEPLTWDNYDEAVKSFGCPVCDEPDQITKLLGYADLIQGEMLEECEMVSRGIYCGNARPDMSEEEAQDIRRSSEDWTLLFQMGSIENDDSELMWGDAGCIYFYIRKQDLKNRDFSKVWLLLQCC